MFKIYCIRFAVERVRGDCAVALVPYVPHDWYVEKTAIAGHLSALTANARNSPDSRHPSVKEKL